MALQLVHLNKNSDCWDQFYRLPEKIYGNDANYCNASIESSKKNVNRPEFINRQLPLLVVDGSESIARLVVRTTDNLARTESVEIGLFGFFESKNNAEAVKLLFDEGIKWLVRQGISTIIGPMDGDTWHKYRFNVGPFDSRPFMMEPYNPDYYSNLWEKYGFCVLSKYYSKRVLDIENILPKFERIYNQSQREYFRFRRFRLDVFDDELKILYDLSCRIFTNNYYYSKISEKDFLSLYKDLKYIIDPNLVWFCQDKNNGYAGFIFSFPDYFDSLKSMNGKSSLWARTKFLLNRKNADILNIKTLGITPESRGMGLGHALMYKVYYEGLKLGYKKANMCLIHEENASSRMDGGQGIIFRHYHLYSYLVSIRK